MPSIADQQRAVFAAATGKSPVTNSNNQLERYFWASQINMADSIAEVSSVMDVKHRALAQLGSVQGWLPVNPQNYSTADLEYRWLYFQLGLSPTTSPFFSLNDLWLLYGLTYVGGGSAGAILRSDAIWYGEAREGSQQSGYMRNLSYTGTQLDAYAGGTLRPYLAIDGGIYLPAGTSNILPSTSPNVVGDIDIRARVRLNDWTPANACTIAGKYGTPGQHSWLLRIFNGPAGTIAFHASLDGTALIGGLSSVVVPATDGSWKWVRVTRVAATGTITFYTSDDGTTWTQLGTTVASTTGNLFAGNLPVQVGMWDGNQEPLLGAISDFQLYQGSTKLLHFRASDLNTSTLVGTGPTGETWRVVSPTSTNDPVFLPFTGEKYLYTPGATGNYASTPSSPALAAITSDIDVVVRANAGNWRPSGNSVLVSRTNTLGSQNSWMVMLISSGVLIFYTSIDGISWDGGTGSSVVVSLNGTGWVRVTRRQSDGRVQFFQAADQTTEPTTWTQLGINQTLRAGETIYGGTGLLSVGGITDTYPFLGNIYEATVRNGIGGSEAAHFKASDMGQTGGRSSSTGETWTINRTLTGRKTVLVERPVWLFGTDDWFQIADNALLDMGAGQDFTLVLAMRTWANPTESAYHYGKQSYGGSPGWMMIESSNRVLFGTGRPDNTVELATGRIHPNGEPINVFFGERVGNVLTSRLGTVGGTPNTVGASVDLSNALNFRIGSHPTVTTQDDFEYFCGAIFRRKLTAAEIQDIGEYITIPPLLPPFIPHVNITILTEPFNSFSAWTTSTGWSIVAGGQVGTYGSSVGTNTLQYDIDASLRPSRMKATFWYRTPAVIASQRLICQMRTFTNIATLDIEADGKLTCRRGGSVGLIVGQTTGVIAPNTWYRLSFEASISGTTGVINGWLDGVQFCNYVGDTQQNTIEPVFSQFIFNGTQANVDELLLEST